MEKIHCNTEVPEQERIVVDLEDIEKAFYVDLGRALLEHISHFLLYAALLGLGAWLAFYYMECYAERQEKHG